MARQAIEGEVREETYYEKNPLTKAKYLRRRRVYSGPPPDIDEVPPAGLEGIKLTKEKPIRTERVAGIELSQTRHDRGLDED